MGVLCLISSCIGDFDLLFSLQLKFIQYVVKKADAEPLAFLERHEQEWTSQSKGEFWKMKYGEISEKGKRKKNQKTQVKWHKILAVQNRCFCSYNRLIHSDFKNVKPILSID